MRCVPLLLGVLVCGFQDENKPKDLDVKVKIVSTSTREFRVDGECPLPDGVAIRAQLYRMIDDVQDDGSLRSYKGVGPHKYPELRDGRFTVAFDKLAPGLWEVDIDIPLQEQLAPAQLEDFKKRMKPEIHWRFSHALVDPALPARMAAELPAQRTLIADLRTHVFALQAASAIESEWTLQKDAVLERGLKLLNRGEELDRSPDAQIGTLSYVKFAARSLYTNPWRFVFEDGKLKGVAPRKKDREFLFPDEEMNGPVWWEGLVAGMDEAKKILGREFALRTLTQLRALPENKWPELRASLAKVPASPELDPWMKRLNECGAADLDALERELRAPTIESRK